MGASGTASPEELGQALIPHLAFQGWDSDSAREAMKQLFHAFASRAVLLRGMLICSSIWGMHDLGNIASKKVTVSHIPTEKAKCVAFGEAGSVAKPGGGRSGRVALGLQD